MQIDHRPLNGCSKRKWRGGQGGRRGGGASDILSAPLHPVCFMVVTSFDCRRLQIGNSGQERCPRRGYKGVPSEASRLAIRTRKLAERAQAVHVSAYCERRNLLEAEAHSEQVSKQEEHEAEGLRTYLQKPLQPVITKNNVAKTAESHSATRCQRKNAKRLRSEEETVRIVVVCA
jgi:hypothetical protein